MVNNTQKTYPADYRKIAAVDSNKQDWDWKNRKYWKKKFFVQKQFLSLIYFDGFRSWTYFCFLERGYRGYYQYQ